MRRSTLLLLALGVTVNLSGQTPKKTTRTLRLQEVVTVKPARQGVRLFRVTAPKAGFIQITVSQQGADTEVVLRTAGKELCASDTPVGEWEPETLECVLPSAGTYEVQVRVQATTSSEPFYTVLVEEFRSEVPTDLQRVAVQQHVVNATRAAKAQKADFGRAIRLLDGAIGAASKAGDKQREAKATFFSAVLQSRNGENKDALTRAERAVMLFEAAGDLKGSAASHNEAGWFSYLLSKHENDWRHQNDAERIWKKMGDRRGLAATDYHLGRLYIRRDERDKAEESYRRALAFYREQGDTAGESNVLDYLGNMHLMFGDKVAAVRAFAEALRLVAGKDPGSEAFTRHNLGATYQALGEFELAIEHLAKARTLAEAAGERTLKLRAGMNAAACLTNIGRPAEAIQGLLRALQELEPSGDQIGSASALNNLSFAYREIGKHHEALDYAERAYRLFTEINEPRGRLISLTNAGRLSFEVGDIKTARLRLDQALRESREGRNLDQAAIVIGHLARLEAADDTGKARQLVEEAIALAESERARLTRDDLRASYLSVIRPLYELKAELLVRAGETVSAFETSERARARALVEVLGGPGNAPPELKEREARLRRRVRSLLRSADKNAEDVIADLHSVQAQIRSTAGDVWEGQKVGARQALDSLGPDEAGLEIMLGDDRSHLWVLHRGEIAYFELPKGSTIDRAAIEFREAVIATAKPGNMNRYHQAGAALSKLILKPAKVALKSKRLVIVTEGELQLVPFGALPNPDLQDPLAVTHELVMLPSFAALAQIRRRPRTVQRPPRMALVGDPVYGFDDERLQSKPQDKRGLKSNFERLGSAEDELIDIAKLAGGNVKILTGFDAAVKSIEGDSLEQFDIIHFATHAELNGRRPELSRLVLSQLDAAGHETDGSFRLVDVYSMKLNARIVILSACDTAAGRNLRGEGVMSLTRGFFSAGASSVISSLWLVADNAAATLMRNLYVSMLQQGMSSTEAMRVAQSSIRQQRRWYAPYFWAPFVLQGEWR